MILSVLLQLPELILREVIDRLSLADQERVRLVCKPWRDHVSVQLLAGTLNLSSARDLELRVGHLKSLYPNAVIQVKQDKTITAWDRSRVELLANPLCDILKLACEWTSSEPPWSALAQYYQSLLNDEKVLPRLQLDMKVTYTCSLRDVEQQGIITELGSIVSTLSIIGDLPMFVQHFFLTNLTELEYRLPILTSDNDAKTEAERIQAALLSLPSLCYLALQADRYGVQPAHVLQVLPQLPNLSALRVTTGINPCCLDSSFLLHITQLSLGRHVTFDTPPQNLRSLHLDFLSQSCRPMLLQLEQDPHLLCCITVGFFEAASQFETCGLLELPINLRGLRLRQQLDKGVDDILTARFSYVQGFSRLSHLQVLLLNEPLTETLIKLLSGCRFPSLHRLGFWLAVRTLRVGHREDGSSDDDDKDGDVKQVLVSLPVQFADLSLSVFPVVEVMEVLDMQFSSQRGYQHYNVSLDSWWMAGSFPHLRFIRNRCRNTSLQLCNHPLGKVLVL